MRRLETFGRRSGGVRRPAPSAGVGRWRWIDWAVLIVEWRGGGVRSVAVRHAFAVVVRGSHTERGIGESMPPGVSGPRPVASCSGKGQVECLRRAIIGKRAKVQDVTAENGFDAVALFVIRVVKVVGRDGMHTG